MGIEQLPQKGIWKLQEKFAVPQKKNEADTGNILIIDDDSITVTVMETMILDAGYHVATATDPVAALEMNLPFKPDIILTDIMMPQMSGLEFIDKIKESCQNHGIRIIAVSSLNSSDDIERAIEAGAADYLAKPFHPEELLLRIERQMHHLRRQEAPVEPRSDSGDSSEKIRAENSRDEKTGESPRTPESVEIVSGPRLEPSGAKILIVDDDLETRALLNTRLKEIGHRVFVAGDGEEGIGAAEREEPDLIILDILMPGMSGYDVARTLAERPHTADIPILMLSARSGSKEISQGLLGYADDYVTKPFNPDELLSRVGALIRRTHKPVREKRAQRWVIQLLADKARNKSHQIYSRHIAGEKELPSWWKAPSPDLLTKWGNSCQAYLVETVESLHDEKTISRWQALEGVKNVYLTVVGVSRETAGLAKKIKSERGFQARIMWSRPRDPRVPRWKEDNPAARRLVYAAVIVAILASLFVSGIVPNIIDRIGGINTEIDRQLKIYQPRDSERSLKTIREKEIQLEKEKRRILQRP